MKNIIKYILIIIIFILLVSLIVVSRKSTNTLKKVNKYIVTTTTTTTTTVPVIDNSLEETKLNNTYTYVANDILCKKETDEELCAFSYDKSRKYKKYNIEVDITKLSEYFSPKAINKIKEELLVVKDKYYDNGTLLEKLKEETIFSSIRKLTLISKTDEIIVLTGQDTTKDEYPLYITFVNINGEWLIDSYE